MSVPRPLEGFDVTSAVERMLGQSSLWWQALGLFSAHFQQWEADWLGAQGDDDAERKLVHALASGAANVGAVALYDAAAALEHALLQRRLMPGCDIPETLRSRLQAIARRSLQCAGEAYAEHCRGEG